MVFLKIKQGGYQGNSLDGRVKFTLKNVLVILRTAHFITQCVSGKLVESLSKDLIRWMHVCARLVFNESSRFYRSVYNKQSLHICFLLSIYSNIPFRRSVALKKRKEKTHVKKTH